MLLICDADQKTPSEKRDMILRKVEMNEEFCVEKHEDHFQLKPDEIEEGERISISMDIYVFPDNCNPDILEDLLLEFVQTQFPELLDLATDYMQGVEQETMSTVCVALISDQTPWQDLEASGVGASILVEEPQF